MRHSPRRPRKLERLILLAVLSIVEHPIRALVIAGIILAVCGSLALAKLNISSDEDKLFSEHVKFFQDYLEFDRKFPENEAVYVIVEAKDPKASPTLSQWTGIADSIAKHMRAIPKYVESVDAHIPLDKLGNQAVLFDEPESLHANFEDAKRMQELARLWGQRDVTLPGVPKSLPLTALLGRTPIERYLSGVALIGPSEDSVGLTHAISGGWVKAVKEPDRPIAAGDQVPDLQRLGADTPRDLGYYFEPDEQNKNQSLMLIRVYPRAQYDALTSITDTVAGIRAAAKKGAAGYESLFKVGVTGRPALDADEMETTDRDSMRSEIVAAIAVFVGLVVMLRSLWLAFVAELALGVGIGWTFGWATATVHELNLLSIVFLIALIGIGMDYLVQVLTRYRVESRRHERAKAVWLRVFKHVAAPINTACLGAAGAFFVSIFTDFRGAAELGIVAGGGLILCLIAGYTVLPAILTLWPGKFSKVDVALRTLPPPPTRGPIRLVLPIIWIAALCG
ncbi:MAG TPA: MMPL family transporter, partial [Tepidisphaeraceae bacterium]|nr:MMPL family transporter [Tepidisphaeraceae bacterium]